MNANEAPCDHRNGAVGKIYNSPGNLSATLFDEKIEIDYRGLDVNPEAFIRVLTGNHLATTTKSQMLMTNENSTILIFLTGHGGNEFFKFHDQEELSAQDIAIALKYMEIKKRYKKILFIADTCQASTLFNYIKSPNIITIGSSRKDENSWAYISDPTIRVPLIDRFSYSIHNYFQYIHNYQSFNSNKYTFSHLLKSMDVNFIYSNPELRTFESSKNINNIKLIDYFGSNENIMIPLAFDQLDLSHQYQYQYDSLITHTDIPEDSSFNAEWFEYELKINECDGFIRELITDQKYSHHGEYHNNIILYTVQNSEYWLMALLSLYVLLSFVYFKYYKLIL